MGYGFNFVDEKEFIYPIRLNSTEKDYIINTLIRYQDELESQKRGYFQRRFIDEDQTLKQKLRWVKVRIEWVMKNKSIPTDELKFLNDINGIN